MTEPTDKQKRNDPLPDKYQWKGHGVNPPFWYAEDGIKVYRSYEDYCDD